MLALVKEYVLPNGTVKYVKVELPDDLEDKIKRYELSMEVLRTGEVAIYAQEGNEEEQLAICKLSIEEEFEKLLRRLK